MIIPPLFILWRRVKNYDPWHCVALYHAGFPEPSANEVESQRRLVDRASFADVRDGSAHRRSAGAWSRV